MKTLLICPHERPEVAALAETVPLSNLSMLGKTLLEYWIEHQVKRGARDILILSVDRPEQVHALVGTGCRWGVSITVVPQKRELTAVAARQRYCGTDRTGWLAAPDDVRVMDHLPGLADYPLFTSYADWMSALKNQLPRGVTPERIGVREPQPGVWIGLHARISPGVELRAPCWIGEDVFVGAEAVIGPGAILEKGSFIGCGAEIFHSMVAPETFVGEATELRCSIAAGQTLINWRLDSAIKVPDAFLLCSLARRSAFRSVGLLSRVTALVAWLLLAPLALLVALRAKLRGGPAFRPLLAVRPQLRDTPPVPGDTMVYYEIRTPRGWLRRWPQLWNIVRGQFAWVGNRPLSPQQAARLTNDFERLWLTTRLGFVCLADTESGCDVQDVEARAHASYYAVHANWRLEGHILLRALFRFTFGVSLTRVREAGARVLQFVSEQKAY